MLADARAQLEWAEFNLSRTEIRARFAGHVTQRLASVGEYIDDDFDDSANNRMAGYGSVGYKFGKNVVTVAVAGAGDSDAEDHHHHADAS